MTLSARIVVTARSVDALLDVAGGTTLALLGPNGSGKTTLLEALAGLVMPDAGSAMHDGRELFDAAGKRWLPMRARSIGLVSQDTALFPTMSVADNVAFGPSSRGAPKREARATARDWLTRVGAAHLADRRPSTLSGGQARRVAIARAFASGPQLMLLDEPFAGLDMEAATHIRTLVTELLPGMTTILTTHNALDAHALATTVAILDQGRVVDSGPVDSVLTRPRTAFAARMGARVLITGSLSGDELVLEGGERIAVTHDHVGDGAVASVAVRPGAVDVRFDGPGDPSVTWIRDTITWIEPQADVVRITGARAAADADPQHAAAARAGHDVWFGVPPGAQAYAT